MGNCWSNRKTKSPKEYDTVELHLIRQSWKEITKYGDYKEYGLNMMIKIFIKRPDIKYLWKYAANFKTEDDMRKSDQLRSHGKNVFEAINGAVNSLDKLESLDLLLIQLGNRHSMVGAKIEYFPVFKEALVQTLAEALEQKFTNEHMKAWNNFIDYISVQMIKGM